MPTTWLRVEVPGRYEIAALSSRTIANFNATLAITIAQMTDDRTAWTVVSTP